MGKELPAMNNYTWHILFRVLTTTAQPGQDTVFKYSLEFGLLDPRRLFDEKFPVRNSLEQ